MKILKASLSVAAVLFLFAVCTGCPIGQADTLEREAAKKYADVMNAQIKQDGSPRFQCGGIVESDKGFGGAVIVDNILWTNTQGSNPIKYEIVICLYRDDVLYAVNETARAAFPDMPKAPEKEIEDITTFVDMESSTVRRMQADAFKG